MTDAHDAPPRDAGQAALGFLRALEKLPPYTGIVFHGLPAIPDIVRAKWTDGVTATSHDPRIATENFRSPVIAAILSRTGRDISAFSAHPHEREVVLPPQIMLHTLAVDFTSDGVTPLVVIEQLAELDTGVSLPPTLEGLLEMVRGPIAEAESRSPVDISSPAKFTEQLHFLS